MANKAALMKLGVLESLLALAVGGGGIPSCPVRTQVASLHAPYLFCLFPVGVQSCIQEPHLSHGNCSL